MSSAEDVLHHQGETGWLVLSSRIPRLGGETPELAAHLVERIDLSKLPVVISHGDIPAVGLADLINDLSGLLGAEPALMSTTEPPPPELSQLSLIILTGGTTADWVDLLAESRLADLLLEALTSGAIIIAAGEVASSLGSWYVDPQINQIEEGAGWVAGAVIMIDESSPSDSNMIRLLMEDQPRAYALGLAEHTLVALGPGGQIEVWGTSEPTIVLGPGWSDQ